MLVYYLGRWGSDVGYINHICDTPVEVSFCWASIRLVLRLGVREFTNVARNGKVEHTRILYDAFMKVSKDKVLCLLLRRLKESNVWALI